jgi:hypothetical protein
MQNVSSTRHAFSISCQEHSWGASSAEQQQRVLRQLFALQVSCLKCLWKAWQQQQQAVGEQEWSDSVSEAWDGVCKVASTCMAVLLERNSSSMRQQEGGSQDHVDAESAAAAAPWVALWARCFFVWAGMMAGPVDGAANSGDNAASQSDTDAVADTDRSVKGLAVPSCCIGSAVIFVDTFSVWVDEAGLPDDVVQQLEQQREAVKAQLGSLEGTAAAAEAAATDAAGLATSSHQAEARVIIAQETAAAQQLRSYAQAVAGRLPLSTACNNPGCVSLAQRSELLLVGGKSCVCGRCKAAR